MKRLAVIITHPIQYYAPIFNLISLRQKIQIKVYYTWSQAEEAIWDSGFDREIKWDIPLLDGYEYEFVKNEASNPGIGHFKGLVNPSLISRIKLWNANAVLVVGWNYYSHLQAIRHFKGKIPVYFRGDSTLLDERFGIKKILRRIFLRWVYKHVDYVFFVGSNNKQYFLAHGLKEHQLIFAPHAIDNSRFNDITSEYEKLANEERKKLGIPENSIVILFSGKFEPKKNPEILIKAIKEINGHLLNNSKKANVLDNANYRYLIFVGNGIQEHELKKLAGNDNFIHFLPFQNQSIMPVIYRMGDIFCLPSTGPGETWGLAVNEAMACSKPVILSDKVGCAIDLIMEKETGFIFENGNCNELINILYYINQNRQSLKDMGIKAHEHVQNFSFLNLVQSIEGALI
jgi:glycosyltransferase involved in cell wall biosynthesis